MPDNNLIRGIEDVKIQLESDNVGQKIAALSKALEYGQEGLNLVIQSLDDELWQIQHAAFMLLRQRSFRSTPQVKKALRRYITIDGQYPDERQEIKRFLSDSSWATQNEYGSREPLPELLQFMKWGEVLVDDANATSYRFEGIIIYIVDCQENRKVWRCLSLGDGGELTIPLKFLQKKGYSYYVRDLLLVNEDLRMNLSTINWNEFLVFSPDEDITPVVIHARKNDLKKGDEGELLEKDGNWFIISKEFSEIKLPRVNNFYRIPKSYLARLGYSYYHQISQLHQLPLIGYLSSKEYLDFLNLQILDFLSLKPIWSPS
ncbi:hypothetical protein [Allocoleopsis sp.]|uniref:hypothetical protein n=1 Tax=Allocoleopsis sp. TaxID=3088169 RepID=UPI002FD3D97F